MTVTITVLCNTEAWSLCYASSRICSTGNQRQSIPLPLCIAALCAILTVTLPACEQQSECSSFKKMLVVVCRLHDMNVYGIPPESMEKTLQDAILYYEGK